MDLDIVQKSHDCPYIVQCYGIFITEVSEIEAKLASQSSFLQVILLISLRVLLSDAKTFVAALEKNESAIRIKLAYLSKYANLRALLTALMQVLK